MVNQQRPMFTENEIEKAVSFLAESAPTIGVARGRMTKADAMLAHVEAIMMQKSDASSDVRRRVEARASKKYLAAIDERAAAAAEFEKLKSEREAAMKKINAWQTESSNWRSIRV